MLPHYSNVFDGFSKPFYVKTDLHFLCFFTFSFLKSFYDVLLCYELNTNHFNPVYANVRLDFTCGLKLLSQHQKVMSSWIRRGALYKLKSCHNCNRKII
jgi:hypothetical protein